MVFYDIDLEKKIESNHELRKINECIDFSSVAYRVNSGKSEVGRHGIWTRLWRVCFCSLWSIIRIEKWKSS